MEYAEKDEDEEEEEEEEEKKWLPLRPGALERFSQGWNVISAQARADSLELQNTTQERKKKKSCETPQRAEAWWRNNKTVKLSISPRSDIPCWFVFSEFLWWMYMFKTTNDQAKLGYLRDWLDCLFLTLVMMEKLLSFYHTTQWFI